MCLQCASSKQEDGEDFSDTLRLRRENKLRVATLCKLIIAAALDPRLFLNLLQLLKFRPRGIKLIQRITAADHAITRGRGAVAERPAN